MKLGEKIHILRKDLGLTMQELADKSKLTKGYISMLEKGKNPQTGKEIIPSLETVQNISMAFNMELETLLKDTESNVELPNKSSSTLVQITETSSQLHEKRQLIVLDAAQRQLELQNKIVDMDEVRELFSDYQTNHVDVSLYGSVSAGTGVDLYDEVVETIRYPEPIPIHDIALIVNGDSMSPLFQDGEVIFVRKTQDVHSGQIGVFIINGQGFVKKLLIRPDSVKLISLSNKYKDITLTESDHVSTVGVVIL